MPTTNGLIASGDELRHLVETMPTKKRAAFQKAITAACKHLKATKEEYAKTFEMNWAMFENAWRLGNEAQKLKSQGHLSAGSNTKNQTSKNGRLVAWSDLGLSRQDGNKLLAMREKFELAELHEWFEEQYDEEKYKLVPIYRATTVAAAVNTGECEWYTPKEYIDLARKVMGSIDTDPASNDLANKTVQADVFYTQETDGLTKEWQGNVWLNPPYAAGLVAEFTGKLIEQVESGNTKQAILLVNNATDTQWFLGVIQPATAICFKTGRIAFVNQQGDTVSGAAQGQCFLYFGRKAKRFCDVFGTSGWVLMA